MTVRAAALRVHRWVGLALTPVLLCSGATGLLLLTGAWLERDVRAAASAGSGSHKPVAVGDVVQALERRGLAPLVRLRLPLHDLDAYEAWIESDRGPRAYVGARTGVVHTIPSPSSSTKGFLFHLHSELLGGALGKTVVGVGALGVLLLGLTGTIVWWPARLGWRRALRVRGGRALLADLHRASGIVALPVLFVIALSGASLAFPTGFERALEFATGSPRRPGPPAWSGTGCGTSDQNWTRLVEIADAALPGGRISWLYFPPADGGWFVVRKRLDGETHPNGKSFTYVDPCRGVVAAVIDAREGAFAARLFDELYPAHIGDLLGRAFHYAGGIAILLLATTGGAVWWSRRR